MKTESRLRRSEDFERARASGRGWSHVTLACYVLLREELGPTRVGIVVSRRVGNAVVRNRVRRRVREALRVLYPEIPPNFDVVVTARPPSAAAPFEQLNEALCWLLGRAGLLRRSAKLRPETRPASLGQQL